MASPDFANTSDSLETGWKSGPAVSWKKKKRRIQWSFEKWIKELFSVRKYRAFVWDPSIKAGNSSCWKGPVTLAGSSYQVDLGEHQVCVYIGEPWSVGLTTHSRSAPGTIRLSSWLFWKKSIFCIPAHIPRDFFYSFTASHIPVQRQFFFFYFAIQSNAISK